MIPGNLSLVEYHGLAKNSLWVMLSHLSMVFVLALTAIGSRVLGDTVFGQYVFLLAVATLLSNLCVFGTTDYVSILCAREAQHTSELVANALGLRIPFSCFFMLVCLTITYWTMPEVLFVSLLIALDWIIRTVVHLVRGVMRARNAFHLDALVSTVERLAVLVCAALGLFLSQSLLMFALGFVVGRTLGLLACFHAYYRLGESLWIGFKFDLWRRILRGGWPIGMRHALHSPAFRIDAIMLGILRASAEVGWYGAAYKLLEISFFLREAIVEAIQPSIAKAYGQRNVALIRDLYGRAYKVLLITGGLAVAWAFAYVEPLVGWIFGPQYTHTARALAILVWAMLFMFGSTISLALLDAIESGRRGLLPSCLAMVINVILNVCLIPLFGYLGASWSTLLTEVLLAAVLLWLLIRLGYMFPLVYLYGPLLACAASTLVALLFPSDIVLGMILALVTYLGILLVCRVFDEIDVNYGSLLMYKVMRKFALSR